MPDRSSREPDRSSREPDRSSREPDRSSRKPDDARGGGPAAFGDLLAGVTRQAGLSRSKPIDPVFRAWDRAAGETLARVARPVRFRAGELAVDVSTASHHHELVAFTGERLRREVNEILGDDRVRRITFKHQTNE
jgi:hypothetical protein